MRRIKFVITEDEVRKVAGEIGEQGLSGEQVQSILNTVEYDEMLAKDIQNSIKNAIRELLAPF